MIRSPSPAGFKRARPALSHAHLRTSMTNEAKMCALLQRILSARIARPTHLQDRDLPRFKYRADTFAVGDSHPLLLTGLAAHTGGCTVQRRAGHPFLEPCVELRRPVISETDGVESGSYRVAVRELCEFAAKSGDLDHRFTPSPSAQQGIAATKPWPLVEPRGAATKWRFPVGTRNCSCAAGPSRQALWLSRLRRARRGLGCCDHVVAWQIEPACMADWTQQRYRVCNFGRSPARSCDARTGWLGTCGARLACDVFSWAPGQGSHRAGPRSVAGADLTLIDMVVDTIAEFVLRP